MPILDGTDRSPGKSSSPLRKQTAEPYRILIIEDILPLTNVIKESINLIFPGTEVSTYDDVTAALKSVEENQFVLILVDASLVISYSREKKRWTADSIIEKIQKHQLSAQVVLMSGLGKEDLRKSIPSCESLPFLQKPFVFTDLFALIQSAIPRK